MSVRLELRQLTLEGFGLYADRTVFDLDSGLVVLAAPNESGKSTFFAGIQSVLFGLPEKSDPELWGTGRFRNWTSPARFRGEALLCDGEYWHRIRRDFATHEVHWAAALAEESLDQPPEPTGDRWEVRFHDEHNPSGRGEELLRYQDELRDLLGIDSAPLFRLTYCVTQDAADRSDAETAFRARQVPDELQGLISGSGGQVDDILTRLFDEFASITQATGDAKLIRPGRSRPANQRNAGRLEKVRQRRKKALGELAAAEAVLEDLQGSQERLNAIRENRQSLGQSLEQDRALLRAWEEWARLRRERRGRHQRVVEIEKALHDRQVQEQTLQRDEERLATAFPEYRNPSFPFDERRRELEDLIGVEKERTSAREALEEARTRQRRLQEEVRAADDRIAADFAAVADRPHLLRDFDEWQKVSADLNRLQTDLDTLEVESAAQQEIIDRLGFWAELDPDPLAVAECGRPAARLRELQQVVPRLIERAEEAERLGKELLELEERLALPEYESVSGADEERLREAEAYGDRHALHRIEAEKTASQLRDIQQRREEVEHKETSLENLQEALALRLGPGGSEKSADEAVFAPPQDAETAPPSLLPPAWQATRDAIGRKAEALREEAQLLRRIDEADRGIRAGFFRQVILPALAGFVAGGAVGAGAGWALLPELPGRLGVAAAAAVLAAGAAGLIGYRRNKGALLQELSRSRARLGVVRRALADSDRELGDLARLDLSTLQELLAQLANFEQLSIEVAKLKALAPSADELTRAVQESEQAAMDLSEFERRMAPFGEDPAALVADWRRADRRAAEIRPRLSDLISDVGAVDWAEQPIGALTAAWAEPIRLAGVIAKRDVAQGSQPTPPAVGREVVTFLRSAKPETWEMWVREAEMLEDACRGAGRIAAQREALAGADGEDQRRTEELIAREKELRASCDPFVLETPREELQAAIEEYNALRRERERNQTLLAELARELPPLETRHRQIEERIGSLRDVLRGLLRPSSGDPVAAAERLAEASKLSIHIKHGRETHERVLASLDVSNISELQIKLEEAREESGHAGERIRELEQGFVYLHEMADAEPEVLQRQQAEIEQRIRDAEAQISHLEEEKDKVQSRVSDTKAEGDRLGNVAVLELEIARLETEEKRLERERDALLLAFNTIREAESSYSHTHRERLEEHATRLVQVLSLTEGRAIKLGPRFEINVVEGAGQTCAVRQLSQGARDQLAIALRLAVADLLAGGIQPPLLFDDPFLTFDPERLEAVRRTLERIAADRQIILLTHRPELADWGNEITVR